MRDSIVAPADAIHVEPLPPAVEDVQDIPIIPAADEAQLLPMPVRQFPLQDIRSVFRRPTDQSALHISVRAALREYPEAAMVAIKSELKQMLDKRV